MEDNILVIRFSDNKIPEFKELRNKDWLYYGEADNFPDHLLMLYNKSAKHGAIINNKVTYIYGSGLTPTIPNPAADEFLKLANPQQSWNELAKQSLADIELFGGFYWQVVPNMLGTKKYLYLMPFSKIRVSKDGEKYYFKNDWKDNKEEMKCFPRFSPTSTEATIYHFKEYRPSSDNRYSLPCYINALNYIESDVEVSKHTLTNAKTGFSASKFINFYNGEPDEEKKRGIQRRFENAFTGSEGKKIIIGFNNDPNKKPTVDDLGSSDLTKEDFTAQDDLITANIYAGHQITSPTLFGIQEPGKLGAHNELRLSYDIFKNTYANGKQRQFEDVVNYFAKMLGVQAEFEFIDVDPIGYEFSDQTILATAPRSWILEKMGIDPTKYADAPAGGTAPVAQEAMGNENVKNLSGRQHQQVMRIIRQCQSGKMTRDAAATLLKTSLGLSDDDINGLLGNPQQFVATDDELALLFESHGESKEGYKSIKSKSMKFDSDEEDEEMRLLFKEAEGGLLNKIVKVIPKFVIRYSYEKRPEAEGAVILPTSREFCKKMIALDRYYSRQDIQKISTILGYNVFDRAGGFWNNNGKTEKHCRHEWRSHVVIKKVL